MDVLSIYTYIYYNLSIHFSVEELLSGFQPFATINILVIVHLRVSAVMLRIAQITLQRWDTNLYSQGQGLSVPSVPRPWQLPGIVWLLHFHQSDGNKMLPPCYSEDEF